MKRWISNSKAVQQGHRAKSTIKALHSSSNLGEQKRYHLESGKNVLAIKKKWLLQHKHSNECMSAYRHLTKVIVYTIG